MSHTIRQQFEAALVGEWTAIERTAWAKRLQTAQINLVEWLDLLDAPHPMGMRFTWLWGDLLELEPALLYPIIPQCFERRHDITFPGFKRSLTKLLAIAGVPEELEGMVADQLFDWLLAPKIKVAVKVFAMETLCNLSEQYPDLAGELKIVLEDQWDKNSVAFRARGKRILKRLEPLLG